MFNLFILVHDNDPVVPLIVPPAVTTFTQDQVNHLLAEEKRKLQTKMTAVTAEIEALKLTATEAEKVKVTINDLRKELSTKEELAKQEAENLSKKAAADKAALETEKSAWQNRFTEAEISRGIMDAAVANDSFDPNQMVSLLRPTAKLAETVDAEGKPTGKFAVKITFKDTVQDKEVELELTPAEVIKRMKDKPAKFGNLFKSNIRPGLGNAPGNPASGPVNMKDLAQYQLWRKANLPANAI